MFWVSLQVFRHCVGAKKVKSGRMRLVFLFCVKVLLGWVISVPSNLTETANAFQLFKLQFRFINKNIIFGSLTVGDFVRFLEFVNSYGLEGSFQKSNQDHVDAWYSFGYSTEEGTFKNVNPNYI